MKKKFENFLKQLGDSPKKKRNISANVPAYAMFLRPTGAEIWERAFGESPNRIRCVI